MSPRDVHDDALSLNDDTSSISSTIDPTEEQCLFSFFCWNIQVSSSTNSFVVVDGDCINDNNHPQQHEGQVLNGQEIRQKAHNLLSRVDEYELEKKKNRKKKDVTDQTSQSKGKEMQSQSFIKEHPKVTPTIKTSITCSSDKKKTTKTVLMKLLDKKAQPQEQQQSTGESTSSSTTSLCRKIPPSQLSIRTNSEPSLKRG